MAIDNTNIYSLLAATVLANLDRRVHENTTRPVINTSDIKPLHLSSEISKTELIQAEQKAEEKKETVFKTKLSSKRSNIVNRFVRRIWYKRPVSDEDDLYDENQHNKIMDNQIEKKNLASDIVESYSINNTKTADHVPSWIDDEVYGDKVILFSPTMYDFQQLDPDVRWHQEPLIDVIFFHGLAGSAFKTWRQEPEHVEGKTFAENKTSSVTVEPSENETDEVLDIGEETYWPKSKTDIPHRVVNTTENQSSSCWPKNWLSKDVSASHVRMLAVDYESTVSEWQVRSMPKSIIRRSMHDRAQEIAVQLKQAGVGKRPIIWVAHSMGGLLTKYILTNEQNADIRSNTRACVFFSVPHFGAELASFGIRHAFIIRPTVEIEELQPNSKNLLNLHERFLDLLKTNDNIKILSFAENEKTTFSLRYQTVVVPSESSQINIGKFYILNKNHIYICKPNSKDALEYQELRDLIQTIYIQRKNELHSEDINITEDILNHLYMFSSPIEDEMS